MSEGPIDQFGVVGIGASAGGLQALQNFFEAMPATSGLAFVIVTHLAAEQESHLTELIQPYTTMPVRQVQEAIKIERDHLYVIPPNRNLSTIDSHLRLSPLEEARRDRAPIDHFFRTLADTHGEHAIGIVLSGTGSDGTIGLQRIKEAGGLTLVQEPTEAAYDGMPLSAIAGGQVDLVLPIHAMPARILDYATHPPTLAAPDEDAPAEQTALRQILALVRRQTGQDFARYKRSTVLRRVLRRMQIHQLPDLSAYARFLQTNAAEVAALYQNILISVTNFFRDPAVFARLEQTVIPQLFTGKGPSDQVRVWVAGCATGEEAYSLAILLLEQTGRLDPPIPIQIFATDLSEPALLRGRAGLYPETIAADVSAERLARFFSREGGGYRVNHRPVPCHPSEAEHLPTDNDHGADAPPAHPGLHSQQSAAVTGAALARRQADHQLWRTTPPPGRALCTTERAGQRRVYDCPPLGTRRPLFARSRWRANPASAQTSSSRTATRPY